MRALNLTLLLLVLSACGGGGSVTAPVNPPPVDADPGGLWLGTVTYDDETSEDLVAITTSTGRFTLISVDSFGPDTVGQYIGTLMVDGNNVTGTGSAYAPAGATWDDGSSVMDISINAVIDEQATMSGTWSADSGDAGSFELEYDSEYEKNSSLSIIDGVWYVYDDTLNAELTLTVETGGAFAGQGNNGCQSTGLVSIIDAAFNVYGWDVTISNCPIAGDYTGFAVLGDIDTGDPATSQNNVALVSISNDQRALMLPLER